MHSMKDDWAEMGPGNCPCDLNWRSDRPMPAFPEQLNMIPPIRKINGEIINHIQTEHERLVIDAFSVYGYTKDWIVGNVHRVQARTFPKTNDGVVKTIYSVDKCDLFAILDEIIYEVCPGEQLVAKVISHVNYIV